MTNRQHPDPTESDIPDQPTEDVESVLTTPRDVASAGRSCMAIVVLGAVIVLLIVAWTVYRAWGGE